MLGGGGLEDVIICPLGASEVPVAGCSSRSHLRGSVFLIEFLSSGRVLLDDIWAFGFKFDGDRELISECRSLGLEAFLVSRYHRIMLAPCRCSLRVFISPG